MTHKKFKKARRRKYAQQDNEEGFRDNSICIYKMNETEFSPAYPQWVFYHNINNYTDMPSCVRGSYQKLLYNRNIIEFDKKNKNMLRWEDRLHEAVEKHNNYKEKPSNDSFLFLKHLIFIDTDTKRQLHKKIRYEIYERTGMDNVISDDEDFDVELEDDDF
jgi:hypothetical protein